MSRNGAVINRHLRRTVAGWTPELVRSLRRYLNVAGRSRGGKPLLTPPDPYWTHLPRWIAEKMRCDHSPMAPGVVREIQRSQYCLFLCIKIHDDIYDLQAADGCLVFAADLLLLEAERVLSDLFPRSVPWKALYRSCVQDTLEAIVRADALQCAPVPDPYPMLEWYSRECSVFRVGASAVCCLAGRRGLLPFVKAYSDAMAVAGHLIDDFADIEEDLRRGRVNAAAALLFGAAVRRIGDRNVVGVGREKVTGEAVESFFQLVEERLHEAEVAMIPFAVPSCVQYMIAYRRSVERLRDALRRHVVRRGLAARLV